MSLGIIYNQLFLFYARPLIGIPVNTLRTCLIHISNATRRSN